MQRIWTSLTRHRYEIALVLLSTYVGLVALELGYRAYSGMPVFAFDNYLHRQTDIINILQNSEYHPVLGWTLKPNIHVSDFFPDYPERGNYHRFTTTGDFGVRMHGFEIKPIPKNGILAIGDSFTAGSEVAGSETWPAYLEGLVGIPVINAAAGGWGADQIVLRAEQTVAVVEPQAIIVSFLADDILRNRNRTYGGANKPYFTVEDGELVAHDIPVPEYKANIKDMGYIRLLAGYSYMLTELLKAYTPDLWNERFTQIYNFVENDPVAVSCKLMERLKRRMDGLGISIFFIMQHGLGSIAEQDEAPSHGAEVMSCISEMNIPAVDTWNYYQKIKQEVGIAELKTLAVMHNGGTVYGHYSPKGNRMIADLIVEKFFNK